MCTVFVIVRACVCVCPYYINTTDRRYQSSVLNFPVENKKHVPGKKNNTLMALKLQFKGILRSSNYEQYQLFPNPIGHDFSPLSSFW